MRLKKVVGIGDTKVGAKAILNNGNTFFYYDAGYTAGLLAKSKVTATETESAAVSSRPSINLKGGFWAAFDMAGIKVGFSYGESKIEEYDSSCRCRI